MIERTPISKLTEITTYRHKAYEAGLALLYWLHIEHTQEEHRDVQKRRIKHHMKVYNEVRGSTMPKAEKLVEILRVAIKRDGMDGPLQNWKYVANLRPMRRKGW